MATVTGLTAERMLQMEAETIVDGDVVGDHLILKKHDGSTKDAGNVRGPSTAEAVAETADTLVKRDATGGVKATRLRLTATNDASAGSTAHALQIGDDTGLNLIIDNNEIQARNNGLGAKVLFEYGANSDSVAYTPSAAGDFTHKAYVDGLVKAISLGSGVNLDTLQTQNVFVQLSSVRAAGGTNYPEALAGLLEVFQVDTTMIWQRYTPYQNNSARMWVRGLYNGVWSSWTRYGPLDDTGWVALTPAAGFTGGSGNDAPAVRKIGNEVSFKGLITGTITVATTTTITTVPSTHRYINRTNNMKGVYTSGGFVGWSNVAQATGVFAVHLKTPYATGTATIDISSQGYLSD